MGLTGTVDLTKGIKVVGLGRLDKYFVIVLETRQKFDIRFFLESRCRDRISFKDRLYLDVENGCEHFPIWRQRFFFHFFQQVIPQKGGAY